MIEYDTTYGGVELSCKTDDMVAIKELRLITNILKKNGIKVGGCYSEESAPEIMERDTSYVLYLGR